MPTQVVGNASSSAVLFASLSAAALDLGNTDGELVTQENIVSKNTDTTIDLVNVAAIALPATISVAIGTRLGSRLSDTVLKLMFGVTLAAIAPLILHKAYTQPALEVSNEKGASAASVVDTDSSMSIAHQIMSRSQFALAGTAMGFITGLVGVGGGPIIISYLSLQNYRDMSPRQVVGTANLSMLPMMVVGTFSHALHGNVVWRMALPLCMATMAGGMIGGLAAAHAPVQVLQTALSGFLMFTGFSTAKKALQILRLR